VAYNAAFSMISLKRRSSFRESKSSSCLNHVRIGQASVHGFFQRAKGLILVVPNTSGPWMLKLFRNLINPAENDLLRNRLSASQFHVERRPRLLATTAYVKVAGRNSAVLVRGGFRRGLVGRAGHGSAPREGGDQQNGDSYAHRLGHRNRVGSRVAAILVELIQALQIE
jgi:hypothetical protein